MYHLVYPDYDNSIMNITNSILKYYGADNKHSTLSILDKELNKKYRNVVLFLIDGMGSEILKRHSQNVQSLIESQKDVLTSVFPSTTVAATTSVLTGLSPIETGWIGWFQYIKEENKSVIFYYNSDFYNNDHKFDYNVADKYVPVVDVYTQIKQANKNINTIEIFPEFRVPKHNKFIKICETIAETTKQAGENYIYAYWEKLDTFMHRDGPGAKTIADHLKEINEGFEYLKQNIDPDTLLILTADHGQVDIEEIPIDNYPELVSTFEHAPSIETRATAFFIKKGKEKEFEEVFKKNFGDKFILLKSEEVIDTNILGYGEQHERAKEFIGDYMALAIDKYAFRMVKGSQPPFKGQHAGLTKDEMLVPLIIYSPKK